MRRLLATGVALALLSPIPASVPTAHADAAPGALLRLTVKDPNGGTPPRGAILRCHPTGGTHPQARGACLQLTRSGGRIERKPDPGTVCTMIYKPVRAEADGYWHGKRIRFSKQYPNSCVMASHTGLVFRF